MLIIEDTAYTFTLILLEPNVISHGCQYRARSACTSMQSDQAPTSSSHLNIPKNDNGPLQNWKVDYSIKKKPAS